MLERGGIWGLNDNGKSIVKIKLKKKKENKFYLFLSTSKRHIVRNNLTSMVFKDVFYMPEYKHIKACYVIENTGYKFK